MESRSREGELLRESMTHEAWWSLVNGSNFGRFTVNSTLWRGVKTTSTQGHSNVKSIATIVITVMLSDKGRKA